MKTRKIKDAHDNAYRNDLSRLPELRKDEREGMPYMEAYAKYPEMRDMVDRVYERN